MAMYAVCQLARNLIAAVYKVPYIKIQESVLKCHSHIRFAGLR